MHNLHRGNSIKVCVCVCNTTTVGAWVGGCLDWIPPGVCVQDEGLPTLPPNVAEALGYGSPCFP